VAAQQTLGDPDPHGKIVRLEEHIEGLSFERSLNHGTKGAVCFAFDLVCLALTLFIRVAS
jgi:hypothetical protein